MASPVFEHLFSYSVGLQMPPEVVGPVSEGIRVTFYLTGGEVTGPRCSGKVLPVGADWILLREDGIGLVDVRLTMQMDDGALVYCTYNGVLDPGPDGYKAFLNGTLPVRIPLRIAPRFSTAHPAWAWMNRVQAYGVGVADMSTAVVNYDIYAVL
jgi:hypothetical protein